MITLRGAGKTFVLRRELLKLIAAAGDRGLTCDEIESETDLPHQTVSPRIWELVHADALEAKNERRMTRTGNMATVWRATGRPIGTIPKRSTRHRYHVLVDSAERVRAVISIPTELDMKRVRAQALDAGFALHETPLESARSGHDVLEIIAKHAASRSSGRH